MRNLYFERFQRSFAQLRANRGAFVVRRLLSTLDTAIFPVVSMKNVYLIRCPDPENTYLTSKNFCAGDNLEDNFSSWKQLEPSLEEKSASFFAQIAGWVMFGFVLTLFGVLISWKFFLRYCSRGYASFPRSSQRNLTALNEIQSV